VLDLKRQIFCYVLRRDRADIVVTEFGGDPIGREAELLLIAEVTQPLRISAGSAFKAGQPIINHVRESSGFRESQSREGCAGFPVLVQQEFGVELLCDSLSLARVRGFGASRIDATGLGIADATVPIMAASPMAFRLPINMSAWP